MSCRDDADFRWKSREEEVSEEISLILRMRVELLGILTEVMQPPAIIFSELLELAQKYVICVILADFASSSTDVGKKEKTQEILQRVQDVNEKGNSFFTRFSDAHERMDKEGQHWKDVAFKKITDDDLEKMKPGERKQLLKMYAECRSIFNFGRVTFQDFQAEWDEMKSGLDQLVMEYMKELVVLAKGDEESNE